MHESRTVSATTELELARRLRSTGDRHARDRLVLSQQGLVRRFARRYAGSRGPVVDLQQEGQLGLLQAIERYDPDRGVRLGTYAAWWIRAHMLRYVERNCGFVRSVTTTARARLFYQLDRTRERLVARGLDPTREAVAATLGVHESDVVAMELVRSSGGSLDAPVWGLEGEGTTRLDRIVDDGVSPEESLGGRELAARLDGALRAFASTLAGCAAAVFRDRVVADPPASLVELGQRWGITTHAVRRIERRIQEPLRRFLYVELGDSITATLGAQ